MPDCRITTTSYWQSGRWVKLISNDSVGQLLKGLLSEDPHYVLEVVSSLAQIAEQDNRLSALENAVGPLSTLLLAGTDQIRQMSAGHWVHWAARKPIPVLKQALLDEDSNVRMESIRALQKILPKGLPRFGYQRDLRMPAGSGGRCGTGRLRLPDGRTGGKTAQH